MGWCARACVCVTKLDQNAGKLIFGLGIVHDGGNAKCQNGVRDLDL